MRDSRVLRASIAAIATGAVLASCALEPSEQGEPTASPAVVDSGVPKPVIISTQPWTFQGQPGTLTRTPNYRLYSTATNERLMRRLPGFAESAMHNYRNTLASLPAPPLKLDTFLMADRRQWQQLTVEHMGAAAETYLRIQRGGFAARGQGFFYDIGPHDTLAITAHEGWHQYTQRTFKHPLPVWLEEGIAAFMEGFTAHPIDPDGVEFRPWANSERYNQLRIAATRNLSDPKAGGLMSLEQLLTATPQDLIAHSSQGTLTYYAQVWALVHFLHEGADAKYRGHLASLLTDAAEGQLVRQMAQTMGQQALRSVRSRHGPDVFLVYFNSDLDTASREFDAFIDEITRPGAKNLIVQGRSPLRKN